MRIIDDLLYRERVYDLVRRIPTGRLMTYGQIAGVLGDGYTPRTVGYVMHGSPDGVPWQRVLNSQGKCSTGRLTIPLNLQQELLQAEGITFSPSGKCDLNTYLWFPDGYGPGENEQTTLFETGA
jgi:methylated-DNA-protein-cysteine methyltransferase related protein